MNEETKQRRKDIDKLYEYLSFGGPADFNELPMLFPRHTKLQVQEIIQLAIDTTNITFTDGGRIGIVDD